MTSDESWRFESMARSVCRMVMSGGYGEEPIMQTLLHVMDKAFRQGLEEGMKIGRGAVIPVTDLTHVPEIIKHAGHRWREGICH